MTYRARARTTTHPNPKILVGGMLAVATIAAALGYRSITFSSSSVSSVSTTASATGIPRSEDGPRPAGDAGAIPDGARPSTVWPTQGQAAYVLEDGQIHAGPNQHQAPIASVAKVMTAYVVLRDHPLGIEQDGPTITLTGGDVADTNRRRAQEQSVVSIAAGEQLSERQALLALLLPSANNIAAVLARWDAGSVDGFVDRMNAAAASLGMNHTRYTDPSGYDDTTVSTAADQVRIVDRAMVLPVFASIVGRPSATLPVAGIVYNTDTLLGQHGFVGVKTGSDSAAGGCFAFRAIRSVNGTQTMISGVVLGQPGHNQIAAGLAAADALVERIAGHTAVAPQGRVRARPSRPPILDPQSSKAGRFQRPSGEESHQRRPRGTGRVSCFRRSDRASGVMAQRARVQFATRVVDFCNVSRGGRLLQDAVDGRQLCIGRSRLTGEGCHRRADTASRRKQVQTQAFSAAS